MALVSHALRGGRYRTSEQLAVGGMGEIWLGEDTLLQRPVVIKALRADYATDAAFRDRFRDEARHTAVLSHPNVTQVFDFVDDEDDEPPCIVMEYVAGEPLAEILDREAPLDAEQTWSILGQTAAALAAAHQVGIVHRDIKPANILVCPDGTVKVTDFGIARAFGEAGATSPGLVLGTAAYLAPEQLGGEQATTASDLYSLGVVGFECLTGRPPFKGDIPDLLRAHQTADPPPLPSDVPPGLGDLVMALLAKDPADRPGDPEAIASQGQRMSHRNALGGVTDPENAAADPYPAESAPGTRLLTVTTGERPGRRHSTVLALGVLAALIIAATLLATRVLSTGPTGRTAEASHGGSAAGKPVTADSASLVGGSDHPEELHYVTDSKTSTAWFTEHYASAEFGNLKSGVGVRLQVSPSAAVKTVVIHFANAGIAAKLYADSKAISSTSSAPAEWRVLLPSPVKAQSWTIWITRLVADSGGYRAGIADVRFLS